MKSLCRRIIFPAVFLGLLGPAGADAPKKQNIGRYSKLWSKSPFTVPPVKGPDGPVVSALDDYVLSGVSKLPDGYFVVLMNKKERSKRISIVPGQRNKGGFEVVSVIQDRIDYKATKVRIKVGDETGTVGYDEKFLALKNPTAGKKKTPQKPGARPTVPGRHVRPPAPATSSSRVPRVRRVPTPPKR